MTETIIKYRFVEGIQLKVECANCGKIKYISKNQLRKRNFCCNKCRIDFYVYQNNRKGLNYDLYNSLVEKGKLYKKNKNAKMIIRRRD